MQSIMLAAGMGKRLGDLIEGGTKCMVSVNGKSLVERAASALAAAGIFRLVLVVGYKASVLKNFISQKIREEGNASPFSKLEIQFVENSDYDKTNNIYSLYLAREELKKDDTILLESDLIFKPNLILDLKNCPYKNAAAVSAWEDWMDGTVTTVNGSNEITAFIAKAEQNAEEAPRYFKTVNIYKFSREFSERYYVPFLEAYQTAFGKNVYYEEALKIISFLKREELCAFKVSACDWYEIDNPADHKEAEKRFAK